ncbi:MAG: LysR substrate-binding domain-containing protein [Sphingomonas sp.]|uniref:LysR substrate-binding domain-containing protein n=1 Tax=Sphingomonas sp. TaxID=28214 RepID=UPI002274AE82|nr:LysR substrate-binding domain-containing protein [Sphingomonas sp.]MCX8476318.1 LysR substrate-binding domain-containing protein [Sphingomonas sp.]
MNFQQLKYVRAAVQNNLNLTEVANVLFTSQSGVSKQIKELEAELGFEIFVRRGKRLVGITPAGENVVRVINSLLAEADNLKRLSEQFTQEDHGRLIIATTHNQARYVIPPTLLHFTSLYPNVEIELRQGSPKYVAETLVRGEADIGVATEAVDAFPELETHPCFTWEHVAVVPPHHPLLDKADPTLADIAEYPIITYNPGFSGRSKIDAAFEAAGVAPDVRLTATDADVIKAYVELGLGVGIVAQMAMTDQPSEGLIAVPGSNGPFGISTTKVAIPRGVLLRNYAYRFVEALAPHLDSAVLSGARRGALNRPEALLPFSDWRDLHLPRETVALAAIG